MGGLAVTQLIPMRPVPAAAPSTHTSSVRCARTARSVDVEVFPLTSELWQFDGLGRNRMYIPHCSFHSLPGSTASLSS